MSKVKIKLVRSTNSTTKKHKATVRALGLKKIGQTVEKEKNEATMGMVETVKHLVELIEE